MAKPIGIVTLTFVNRTAAEGSDNHSVDDTIQIDRPSVARVVQWYAGHYGGDDFSVFVNGKEIRLDHNGEVEEIVIDMPSSALARRR